jgi:hypothetical protein
MTTKTDLAVDAIRLAWGIGISQAEADSATCVIEDRKLVRSDKSQSYWSRALRNLMLDYARHSRVRKHAVLEILYPRRTGRGNYVETAMIEAIDARRRANERRQEIQLDNILAKIVKVAGQVEHVNTSTATHNDFVARLQAQRKIPSLRLRSTLRFTHPSTTRPLLTVKVTSYFSWPSDSHDWIIRRSAVSLDASDEMSALPQTICCYLKRDLIPDNATVWDLRTIGGKSLCAKNYVITCAVQMRI